MRRPNARARRRRQCCARQRIARRAIGARRERTGAALKIQCAVRTKAARARVVRARERRQQQAATAAPSSAPPEMQVQRRAQVTFVERLLREGCPHSLWQPAAGPECQLTEAQVNGRWAPISLAPTVSLGGDSERQEQQQASSINSPPT